MRVQGMDGISPFRDIKRERKIEQPTLAEIVEL